ncbi:MAG: hypothetical protein PWR29_572 [Methanolobus sp.]|jgi:uncharacterized protein YunC (DUF1805 family)|nr:hypothetical protein [Methanolobus sp.]MDK2833636.1 hypothetical protein [Methanolobus sp.]MDK2911615.1 hypothetical protein [Methanolobus sp.]MDN5308959.1 hypothetical protein [Methanolobus sp.]
MLIEKIELSNGTAFGLSYQMQKAPLIVINADKGFVMCGYLDLEAATALGDVAVKVKGVRTFEDVLKAQVVGATPSAISLGVKVGMTGREALELMF